MKYFLFSIFLTLNFFKQTYSSPGIKRTYHESTHFIYSIDEKKIHLIPELSSICEYSYDSLSKFFNYKLKDKIKLVFFDEDDYANGYAVGFKNWVGIYLTAANFSLRGSSSWTNNVISHELSHIFTLRKLGFTKHYLGHTISGSLSYKKLLGSGTFMYSTHSLENWLAEGLAQFGAEKVGFDYWDAHRIMLEKTAYHTSKIIKVQELKTFWGHKLNNEQIYNHGYSFIRFVFLKSGPEGFETILIDGKKASLTRSISSFFNKSFEEVYEEWISYLSQIYGPPNPALVTENSIVGGTSSHSYIEQFSPIATNQGIFYLSSEDNDFGITHLYYTNGKSKKIIARNASGRLTLSSDEKTLLYIHQKTNKNRQIINELYQLNLTNFSTSQLSTNGRIVDHTFLNNEIYVIRRINGLERISLLKNGNFIDLYSEKSNIQFAQISGDASSNSLFLSVVSNHARKIYQLTLSSKIFAPISLPFQEIRDINLFNNTIYFSGTTDTGFQIFSFNLEKKSISQLTKKKSGAFFPFVRNNELYFSSYGSYGYTIQKQDINTQSFSDTVTGLNLNIKDNQIPPSTVHESNNSFGFPGFLGFTSMLTYLGQPTPVSGDSISLGNQLGMGGAMYFSNPSFEEMITIGFITFKKIENDKSNSFSPSYFAQYSSSSFPVLFDFLIDYTSLALIIKSEEPEDETLANISPTINKLNIQGSFQVPINRYTFFQSASGMQSVGIGLLGISLTLTKSYYQRMTLGFENINPGVDFINSGYFLVGSMGIDYLKYLYSGDILDENKTMIFYEKNSISSFTLLNRIFENFNRILFVEVTTQSTGYLVNWPSELNFDFLGLFTLSSYLPWKPITIPVGNRNLTFKNFFIQSGYTYQNSSTNSNFSTNEYSRISRKQNIESSFPTNPFIFSGKNREDQHIGIFSLNWKVLTFFNDVGRWSVGVTYYPEFNDDQFGYFLNFQL